VSEYHVQIVAADQLALFAHLAKGDGSVFLQPHFLSIYSDQLLRCFILDSQNDIKGIFAVFQGGKWGLKTLITPPYLPTIPFAFFQEFTEEEKRACMLAIASFFIRAQSVYYHLHFPAQINDLEPFFWVNAEVSQKHTRILDLNIGEDELLRKMRSTTRQLISSGMKNLSTPQHFSKEEIFSFFIQWIPGKRKAIHVQIIRGLIELGFAESSVFITAVADETGRMVAANLVCFDTNRAYLLLSAKSADAPSSAQRIAIWHSIQKSIALNIGIWDFEGSSIPGVDDFFKSFGASEENYFQASGGFSLIRSLLRKR
jgi:hypothetical protein